MRRFIRVKPLISQYVRIEKPSRLKTDESQRIDVPSLYSFLTVDFHFVDELMAEKWPAQSAKVIYSSTPFLIQPDADMIFDLDSYWPTDEDYFSIH